MKRVFSLVLSLMMLLSLIFPVGVFAEEFEYFEDVPGEEYYEDFLEEEIIEDTKQCKRKRFFQKTFQDQEKKERTKTSKDDLWKSKSSYQGHTADA